MATPETRDQILKTLTKHFGEPTNSPIWTLVQGSTTEETCEFEFAPVPPATQPTKVVAKVVTDQNSTKEKVTYTKDGIEWKPRTWFGFVRTVVLWTLLSILVFLAGYLLTVYVGIPTYKYAVNKLWTPTVAVPADPAASTTPAPVATPPATVSVTLASPAVNPHEAAALALLSEEQRELFDIYKTAEKALEEATNAVKAKQVQVDKAQADIDLWTEMLKDAKKAKDTEATEMAEAKLNAAKLELGVHKRDMAKLQKAEEVAQEWINKLRSRNRVLLGRGLDEQALERAMTKAVGTAVSELVTAVNNGNEKTGELVTAVNSVSSKVGELKAPLDTIGVNTLEVKKSIDAQTAMLKNYCDRIDSFFTNFSKIYIATGEKADKVVEALNKLETAYKNAKTDGNTDEMKRIAAALEKYLAEKAKAPAPAAPAAPVSTTYAPPQHVQQGQWYAAPCQNSQCYQVRRR